MKLIKCRMDHYEEISNMYRRVVKALNETINYPKWSDEHPSETDIKRAVSNGSLYACVENDIIIGGVVLSEDPEGNYSAGEWSRELEEGRFLVIHLLAVEPSSAGKGVGGFIVEQCIELAKQNGYKAVRLDVVPNNAPALRLYQKKGFSYAGTKDLERNIPDIPLFDLYEINL